jgi:hypothetical protein
MFITISIKILLFTGICGIAAAIANPEYGIYRFGQHLGIGAALVLLGDFGLSWMLRPLFSIVDAGWLVFSLLIALVIMLIAVPFGMFVYSLDFRQGRIFGLSVGIGHLMLSLILHWAASP